MIYQPMDKLKMWFIFNSANILIVDEMYHSCF